MSHQAISSAPQTGRFDPVDTIAMEKAMPMDIEPHSEIKAAGDQCSSFHSEQKEQTLTFDEKQARKLVRRVDVRILPTLGALYAIALVDRVNLGSARILGMDKELGLSKGSRYSLLTFLFFVPYVLTELPTNAFLRRFGSANWLGFIGLAWGSVTIGMGFCKTWGELLACRMLLGAFEGGVLPASLYLLSCWYTRYEAQQRFGAFYLLGVLSSGVGGVLAYGLSRMDGISGLSGWRWIYIMEGLITCAVAVYVFLVVPDFPDVRKRRGWLYSKSFLDQQEQTIVLARIEKDRGDSQFERPGMRLIIAYLRDWKIWMFSMLCLLNTFPGYSFAYFLPVILHYELGYSLLKSQCLFLPPYVFGAVWVIFSGWIADRMRMRAPLLVFNAIFILVGVTIAGYVTNPVARYVGLFIAVAAAQSNVPAIFAYMQNNVVGQVKKAVASAVLVLGGAIGGIVAGSVFRQQDAPRYIPGLISIIVSQVLVIAIVGISTLAFLRANKVSAMTADESAPNRQFQYTI